MSPKFWVKRKLEKLQLELTQQQSIIKMFQDGDGMSTSMNEKMEELMQENNTFRNKVQQLEEQLAEMKQRITHMEYELETRPQRVASKEEESDSQEDGQRPALQQQQPEEGINLNLPPPLPRNAVTPTHQQQLVEVPIMNVTTPQQQGVGSNNIPQANLGQLPQVYQIPQGNLQMYTPQQQVLQPQQITYEPIQQPQMYQQQPIQHNTKVCIRFQLIQPPYS